MKKKILGLTLACLMIVTSFSQIVFARENDASYYSGLGFFAKAEDILDELNADATSEDANLSVRVDQQNVIKTAKDDFYSSSFSTLPSGWANYYEYVNSKLTGAYGVRANKYLQLRFIADTNPAELSSVVNALNTIDTVTYDTTGMTLQEASAVLDDYIDAVTALYGANSTKIASYVSANAAAFVDYKNEAFYDATKAVLSLVFSTVGEGANNSAFDYSYTEVINSDIVKKNLAVIFGIDLAVEFASNDFASTIKSYVKNNPAAISAINNKSGQIFVTDKANAVDALFDVLGVVISGAYDGNEAETVIVNFFGNGTNEGTFERALYLFDGTSDAQNIWINLFLNKFVQMNNPAGPFNTISAKNLTPAKILVYDGMSLSFLVEGLDEYGISSTNLPLRSNYFNIVVESDQVGYTNEVTYDTVGGKLNVITNNSLPETYDAVVKVFRADDAVSSETERYIESYPITVQNIISIPDSGGKRPEDSNVEVIEPTQTTPGEKEPANVHIVSGNNGTIQGPTSIPADQTEAIYAFIPEAGYIVDTVLVNGEEVAVMREG